MDSSNSATIDSKDFSEIIFERPMFIRAYRSGRVERLGSMETLPPSLDPTTGVQSRDVDINPSTLLSARLYLPPAAVSVRDGKLPVLIYFHGGGFYACSASTAMYHNFLNSLASKADILVVSVDYRLAPEHPVPAAYDDAWEALQWVLAGDEPWLSNFGKLDRVFLAGDSAGGNIVHNVGIRLGREGMEMEGALIVHAFFWGKTKIGGELEEKEGAVISVKDADKMWPFVCPGTIGLDDPWLNPLADDAPSLAGLGFRRALVCVAEKDLLYERGRVYYEKLKESGWSGEAEFIETEEEDHDFFLFKPESEKTEAFVNHLASFINN
ncbi:hypothetical protein HPP92_010902 [Vanilla planifolia]|uniref:Alpha/beta hydrolase fold-3 domain-containing protein n=1 Tax=Vanilla planifolia TaxID=51239 RepID=A0A835R3A1_VANPL|nr:hypothetical protein HPP92_011183 [Vanilla planifolia]KAG0482818.1 hypothetical protein HPP92_010902 [Vanilla planifolia]